MSDKLILVQKSNGEEKNIALDVTAKLSETRAALKAAKFMTDADMFLNQNAPVDMGSEGLIKLSALVGPEGKEALHIGSATPNLGGDNSLQRYKSLPDASKLALFNTENVDIYKGLTANPQDGFIRTFKPAIVAWHANNLPNSKLPRVLTSVTTEDSFNEVDKTMNETSTDKASASLTTPYGGGDASFEYAQSHSTSSKEVTQYMIGKYSTRKVALQVERSNLQLTADFEGAILQAAQQPEDIDGIVDVIKVLNDRGWYVPIEFTLGGLLYSTATTKISEYSEASSEKTEFSAGFKAAFDGIGGGASYSHAEGSDKSTTTTTKYNSLQFDQIGGVDAPKDDNFSKVWHDSLKVAINWGVISYDKLFPTVALLSNRRLVRWIIQKLDKYATYDSVKDRQTVIDIEKYSTAVETILTS